MNSEAIHPMLALSVQPSLGNRVEALDVVESQDDDLTHPAVGMEFSSADEAFLFYKDDWDLGQ